LINRGLQNDLIGSKYYFNICQ